VIKALKFSTKEEILFVHKWLRKKRDYKVIKNQLFKTIELMNEKCKEN